MEFTKEELTALMNDVAKGLMTPEALKGLMEPILASRLAEERKAIFAVQDGTMQDGQFKTHDGSVLNTHGFTKAFNIAGQMRAQGINVTQSDFGQLVLSNGGIFTKLSPAMEGFAKLLKCKLDANKLMNTGFNASQYKDQCVEQMKQTGMNEGVGADGGFTVPVEYASTVIEFAILASTILSKVFRVNMKSNSLKYPRLAQTDESFFGGFEMVWLDEGEAKHEHKYKFEQVTFTAHKCAAICVLTDELIEDSLINIINYTTALGTRAWMYELEHCVIDGSGVGQPLGIINDPVVIANAVGRTGAGIVSWLDFINLEAAMNENFRDLAWILRRKTVSEARKQVTTTNDPIWKEGWAMHNATPNLTPQIIGYPYHITRNANQIGHQGDVALADLSYYMLAIRKNMTIDVSPYPYWKTDETAVRFVARVDGKCGTPYAFKILKGTGS